MLSNIRHDGPVTPTNSSTDGSASTSARALARDQLTRTILASARAQLSTVGPAALSVRAVARDVGMASSAVYRYFPSRDDLLTALLVECFDEQGAAVEAAVAGVPGDPVQGWLAAAHTFRRWAADHPWDYALLYGSPVPGYVAPEQTVAPATRAPRVLMGLLADAVAQGVRPPGAGPTEPGPAFHEATTGVRAFAGIDDVPDDLLLAGLAAWSGLVGGVTLELFGHLENAVGDREAWFDALARRLSPFDSAA